MAVKGRYRRSLAALLHKLTASQTELYAQQVREECAGLGCRPVAAVGPGERASVAGRITTVVFTPVASMPVLEAELFDGTATITLTWLGRRRIVGIEPGRAMIAAGRVAMRDGDRKVMFNPWYELTAVSDGR